MPHTVLHTIASADFSLITSLGTGCLDICIVGTLDMANVEAFGDALEHAHEEAERRRLREVRFDLRGLSFLNSSSMKKLTTMALRPKVAGYRIRFLLNGRLLWQARAVAALRRVSAQSVVVESSLA